MQILSLHVGGHWAESTPPKGECRAQLSSSLGDALLRKPYSPCSEDERPDQCPRAQPRLVEWDWLWVLLWLESRKNELLCKKWEESSVLRICSLCPFGTCSSSVSLSLCTSQGSSGCPAVAPGRCLRPSAQGCCCRDAAVIPTRSSGRHCSAPQNLQCPQARPPPACWDVFAIRHRGIAGWA